MDNASALFSFTLMTNSSHRNSSSSSSSSNSRSLGKGLVVALVVSRCQQVRGREQVESIVGSG